MSAPIFDISIDIGSSDRRMHGLAMGVVMNNVDFSGQGRVMVMLPWLPGVTPWARVAAVGAGMMAGVWWQPQLGEEVVLGFIHGEISSPVILGSAWSALERPPALLPTDSVQKRIFATPYGHRIELDDVTQTVTISTKLGQTVELSPLGVTLDAGAGLGASIAIGASGEIIIKSALSLSLEAPEISIKGANVKIEADAAASLEAGGLTTVKGAMVEIN
jgi:uncharacterized protein involved in type VI secretion and phage assembly